MVVERGESSLEHWRILVRCLWCALVLGLRGVEGGIFPFVFMHWRWPCASFDFSVYFAMGKGAFVARLIDVLYEYDTPLCVLILN